MSGVIKYILMITLVNHAGVAAPPTAIEHRSEESCLKMMEAYRSTLPEQKLGELKMDCYAVY